MTGGYIVVVPAEGEAYIQRCSSLPLAAISRILAAAPRASISMLPMYASDDIVIIGDRHSGGRRNFWAAEVAGRDIYGTVVVAGCNGANMQARPLRLAVAEEICDAAIDFMCRIPEGET